MASQGGSSLYKAHRHGAGGELESSGRLMADGTQYCIKCHITNRKYYHQDHDDAHHPSRANSDPHAA
jgi:hypothetical protein